MVHQESGSVIFHNRAVVQGDGHLDQVGIAENAILLIRIVDGTHSVAERVIAFPHILDPPALQEFGGGLLGLLLRQNAFPDLARVDQRNDVSAETRHRDALRFAREVIRRQISRRVAVVAQLILPDPEKISRVHLCVTLRDLLLALKENRLLLRDMVGERTVIDQSGVIRELIGCLFEIIAVAAAEIGILGAQAFLKPRGIFPQLPKRFIFLLRDRPARRNPRGKAHGKVSRLRDKAARLKERSIRNRKHRQRPLRHAGLAHHPRLFSSVTCMEATQSFRSPSARS